MDFRWISYGDPFDLKTMFTQPSPRIDGFVLAGGESSRFGSDKALAQYRGRPLLGHALRALRGLGVPPRIVASNFSAYRKFAADIISGEQPGLGPAEGLRVALVSAVHPWALVLSVDMPGITAAALRPLVDAIDGLTGVICYQDGAGRRHPFPGLYHRSLLYRIMRIREGGAMRRILDSARVRTLTQEDIGRTPVLDRVLRNVNRPDDLRAFGSGLRGLA